MSEKVLFSGVEDGGTFEVAGIEFIKFPAVDGKTPVVAKSCLRGMAFGENPNFKDGYILPYLQREVLPGIVEVVGEENVLEFETDLTTLDGLDPYGPVISRISLPTFDFYRANVGIFDRHHVRDWWWIATPDTAQPHYDADWGLCVSPSGFVSSLDYGGDYRGGVRPILIFDSFIFGACRE